METTGAKVSGLGIVETFHNDDEAFETGDNGVSVSSQFYCWDYFLFFILNFALNLFMCVSIINLSIFLKFV